MSDRSWFFASQGQQQGPYPEARLHDLIAQGVVTAATLVWSEGMTDWQKAGDIPGLLSVYSGPPAVPHAQRSPAGTGSADAGSLSIDFGIWEFVWRTLVFLIGAGFVIPLPWVLVWFANGSSPARRFRVDPISPSKVNRSPFCGGTWERLFS